MLHVITCNPELLKKKIEAQETEGRNKTFDFATSK